jgi:transcriptional/translational regulatory protein YebC/TACO1
MVIGEGMAACQQDCWHDPDTARKVLKLINRLDDHDDVQNVSSSFNIPEAIMAQVGSET